MDAVIVGPPAETITPETTAVHPDPSFAITYRIPASSEVNNPEGK